MTEKAEMRRLREQTAIKIMGWTLKKPTHPSNPGEWIGSGGKTGHGQRTSYGWSPSDDIEDAFEVVEKMRSRGWCIDLSLEPNEKPHVLFYTHRDSYGPVNIAEHEAETIPLAICKAALKALTAIAQETKKP